MFASLHVGVFWLATNSESKPVSWSYFRSSIPPVDQTNNTTLPLLTIATLYKSRWQLELFFKWIKASTHQAFWVQARKES